MITIDMINKKISELSVVDKERSKIEEQILELTNAINATDDEKAFVTFTFTPALQLTRDCGIDIGRAHKMITEIKKAIEVGENFVLDIPMPEEYKRFIRTLKEKFEATKTFLQEIM